MEIINPFLGLHQPPRLYRHLIRSSSCPDGRALCYSSALLGIGIKIQEGLSLKIFPLSNFHPVENISGPIFWQ